MAVSFYGSLCAAPVTGYDSAPRLLRLAGDGVWNAAGGDGDVMVVVVAMVAAVVIEVVADEEEVNVVQNQRLALSLPQPTSNAKAVRDANTSGGSCLHAALRLHGHRRFRRHKTPGSMPHTSIHQWCSSKATSLTMRLLRQRD